MLLVTLGLSIVIENLLLAIFSSDTRTIDTPYGFSTLDLGFVFLSVPKAIGFGVACLTSLALWALLALTDTGKAIRAVAKERMGAALVGIDPAHIFAVTFGLSAACLADRRLPAAADLLCEPARRRSLCAHRLHDRRARRHGLRARRA